MELIELIELILTESKPLFGSGLVPIAMALLTYVMKKLSAEIQKIKSEFNAIKEGIISILYNKLKKACELVIQDGYTTTADLRAIQEIYDSYHDLGGNGIGTKLYDDVLELPIKN